MAVTTTMVALASLGIGAASFIQQQEAAGEARSAQERARGEQEKIRGEQKAQNAAMAAQERRAQIREERVRRARISQSATGTGVAGGSGEFGAIGALGTNLATNIGANIGKVAAGERTSGYAQQAATFMGQAAAAASDAQQSAQLFSLATNIFDRSGGIGSIKSIFDTQYPTGGTNIEGGQ